jgi:hypothetical protein
MALLGTPYNIADNFEARSYAKAFSLTNALVISDSSVPLR